ncbi:MAG: tetrahydrofolate dehydrogenase/cyclohydrolase catalytic domain-containing protein, partial [Nevskiales bacterium]
MSAQIIDGKVISASIREDIKQAISHRKEQHERAPGLAVILVGEDPASQVYVKHKAKACDEVGIVSHIITLPEDIDQHTLLEQVDRYNANPHVDGILVQLPLPKHLNEEQVTERIRPDKDIDGFHPYNIGRLTQKRPTLRPCTPYGVMKMLEATGITTRGARAVIVGASNIVGRPMALELLLADATITVCN